MVKPLSWYLDLNVFRPDIISYFPLLLHAFTDLISIFLDFVSMKWLPFTKKNPYLFPHCDGVLQWEELRVSSGLSCGALVSFWWICLLLWVSIVHILPLICWFHLLWLDSFWFFSTAFFSACVDFRPNSCWSVINFSSTLISCWWKYALLISTVFRKV